MEIVVPGWRELRLTALAVDVNGTLALDGELLLDVAGRLRSLRGKLDVHLLSADTSGAAAGDGRRPRDRRHGSRRRRRGCPEGALRTRARRRRRGRGRQRHERRGDAGGGSAGIAVAGPEGLATKALLASDVVAASIGDARDLLLQRRRLVASLRR